MAKHLYYTIIRVVESPGKGRIELHNSMNKKDLTTDRPDMMAKAFRYFDKGSYRVAMEVASGWRVELEDRFSAIEVDAKKLVWGPK